MPIHPLDPHAPPLPPHPADNLLDLYATWLGSRLTLADYGSYAPYPSAGRDLAHQLLRESERELRTLGLIHSPARSTRVIHDYETREGGDESEDTDA